MAKHKMILLEEIPWSFIQKVTEGLADAYLHCQRDLPKPIINKALDNYAALNDLIRDANKMIEEYDKK